MFKKSYLKTPLGDMVCVADDVYVYLLEFHDRKELPDELQLFATDGLGEGRTSLHDQLEQELAQYFDGQAKTFQTPVKFTGTDFQQKVWSLLQHIPFGETISYAELAVRSGDKNAFRAVAGANGKNKLAIVVPCHRVVNSNGHLGGYAGGLHRKEWLLIHEKPMPLFV